MYSDEFSDHLPVENGVMGLNRLAKVTSSRAAFHCPSDKVRSPPNSNWKTNSISLDLTEDAVSYDYRGGLVRQVENAALPVCWDKPGIHTNGLNVLFCDGHVEYVSLEKWKKIQPK